MGFRKITKPTARKIFNSGRTVYLVPSKANIRSPWISPMPISKRRGSFTKLVNGFEYYNCNRPFGKYAWFYVKE